MEVSVDKQEVTLSIPDYVFRRIERVAEALGQGVDEFLERYLDLSLEIFEVPPRHKSGEQD